MLSLFEHDVTGALPAESVVRRRHCADQRHRRVRSNLLLHRRRADVLPATDDEVRFPSDQTQEAVLDNADVAREHPTVVGEKLGVRGVVAEIPKAGDRSTAGRLAWT